MPRLPASGRQTAGTRSAAGARQVARLDAGALLRTGSGSISAAPASIDTSQGLTIACWLRWSVLDQGLQPVQIKDAAAANYLSLNLGSRNRPYSQFKSAPAAEIDAISTQGVAAGQWYHLAATWDPSTPTNNLKTYLNGLLVAQASVAQALTFGAGLAVNCFGSGRGTIDEIAIWQRVLSATEIQTLRNQGRPAVSPTRLFLAWDLDELTGTSLTDASGNGITGTVTSANWTRDVPITIRSDPPTSGVWYVSKLGNNANGQGWATAWNELSQIDWTKVKPGDTILLDGGSGSNPSPFLGSNVSPFDFANTKPHASGLGMVYTSQLFLGASGVPGNAITIKLSSEAGRNGQAVIYGGRAASLPYTDQVMYTFVTAGVLSYGIVENGVHDVVIDGVKRSGIIVYGCNDAGVLYNNQADNNLTLRNVEIFDNGTATFGNVADIYGTFPAGPAGGSSGGVRPSNWWADGFGIHMRGTNLLFENCLIHDNGQDCIQDMSLNAGQAQANVTLRRCWLFNSRGNPNYPGYPFNEGNGAVGTHCDGVQTWNGGAQDGFTVDECLFGPFLGQGFYPADSGTGAHWTNVSVTNTTFLRCTYDAINGNGVSTTGWTIDHCTFYRFSTQAPDGLGAGAVDGVTGSGHTVSNNIMLNCTENFGTGITSTGNVYFGGDPVPSGTNADPQFVAVLSTNTPSFAQCQAVDLTPQAAAASGKGSPIHTVQDLLDRIDTNNAS